MNDEGHPVSGIVYAAGAAVPFVLLVGEGHVQTGQRLLGGEVGAASLCGFRVLGLGEPQRSVAAGQSGGAIELPAGEIIGNEVPKSDQVQFAGIQVDDARRRERVAFANGQRAAALHRHIASESSARGAG